MLYTATGAPVNAVLVSEFDGSLHDYYMDDDPISYALNADKAHFRLFTVAAAGPVKVRKSVCGDVVVGTRTSMTRALATGNYESALITIDPCAVGKCGRGSDDLVVVTAGRTATVRSPVPSLCEIVRSGVKVDVYSFNPRTIAEVYADIEDVNGRINTLIKRRCKLDSELNSLIGF